MLSIKITSCVNFATPFIKVTASEFASEIFIFFKNFAFDRLLCFILFLTRINKIREFMKE